MEPRGNNPLTTEGSMSQCAFNEQNMYSSSKRHIYRDVTCATLWDTKEATTKHEHKLIQKTQLEKDKVTIKKQKTKVKNNDYHTKTKLYTVEVDCFFHFRSVAPDSCSQVYL